MTIITTYQHHATTTTSTTSTTTTTSSRHSDPNPPALLSVHAYIQHVLEQRQARPRNRELGSSWQSRVHALLSATRRAAGCCARRAVLAGTAATVRSGATTRLNHRGGALEATQDLHQRSQRVSAGGVTAHGHPRASQLLWYATNERHKRTPRIRGMSDQVNKCATEQEENGASVHVHKRAQRRAIKAREISTITTPTKEDNTSRCLRDSALALPRVWNTTHQPARTSDTAPRRMDAAVK